MTREEYAKRMKKHPDWAPGRDAIEAAFARRYPKTEPVCFESELHDRAAFGRRRVCRRLGKRRKLCDHCPGYHSVFFSHS